MHRQGRRDDAWLILSELRTLLSQYIEHLGMIVAGKLSGVSGKREFLERRSEVKQTQELPESASLIIGSCQSEHIECLGPQMDTTRKPGYQEHPDIGAGEGASACDGGCFLVIRSEKAA